MRILLLSDTHSWLDPQLEEFASSCDEIWHAGDIGSVEVENQLKAWKPARIITGNIDSVKDFPEVPEFLHFSVEGLSVLLFHIGGKPGKYPKEAKQLIQKYLPTIFICGHSHIPIVSKVNEFSGMIHMNPGAAGKEGFHRMRTCLRFTVENKQIKDLELIELGLRGKL